MWSFLNNDDLFDELFQMLEQETNELMDRTLTHSESFQETVTQLSQQNAKLREQEKAAVQETIDDLMTDIDRNKIATYSRMPEMILKTGSWESFAVCSACKNPIEIKSYCVKMYRNEPNPDAHKCPCCNTKSATVLLKDDLGKILRNGDREPLYDIYPIPHQRYRRRYHTTEFEKKRPWWMFWGISKPGEGFWEIDHIPHVKPLVTEPPAANPAEEALIEALCKIEDLKAEVKRLSMYLPINNEPAPSTSTKPKRARSKKTTR